MPAGLGWHHSACTLAAYTHVRIHAGTRLRRRTQRCRIPRWAHPHGVVVLQPGDETGHFPFIGVVLSPIALMLRSASRLTTDNQQRLDLLDVLPAYAIGGATMFRAIQRLAAFLGLDKRVLRQVLYQNCALPEAIRKISPRTQPFDARTLLFLGVESFCD